MCQFLSYIRNYRLQRKFKEGTITGPASGIKPGNAIEGEPTGQATSIYMSPIVDDKKNNKHKYMTPIEELYNRKKGIAQIQITKSIIVSLQMI